MDKEYEKKLIDAFFNKSIRERIKFELFSTNKRKDAIGRLSHNWDLLLNAKYMIKIQKPNSDYNTIAQQLRDYGALDICYTISYDDEIDGKYLSLHTALEKVIGFGMPSIVSCVSDKLAYFESEQCYGAPPRFILKK